MAVLVGASFWGWVDPDTNWPQVLPHFEHSCPLAPYRFSPPPLLLVFHHLFLLQYLFNQPTSVLLLFIIFRELCNYIAQLIRIFSKLRTGYDLGLKRLSHEDSMHTAVDFNSPEVASVPVCSFSLNHRGCFICGLRISINTKAAGILVKKRKPKNILLFLKVFSCREFDY